MPMIVCPDCEHEIGQHAQVCPHCGSMIDEQAREYGARRRLQIILHGCTAVILSAFGCLLGGFLGQWLAWGETTTTSSLLIGGIGGFLTGSVLGYYLGEWFTQPSSNRDM